MDAAPRRRQPPDDLHPQRRRRVDEVSFARSLCSPRPEGAPRRRRHGGRHVWGNENDRNHARQFVQRALGSIALKIKGAVLCCAHPSRAGLTSGEGDGGSTGWSNSFRSRLFLRARAIEEGEPPDPNARILERRKANYASRNDEVQLRWRQGVVEPEPPDAPGATSFGKLDAKDVFLSLLHEFEEQNRPLSANSRSGNYAPRLFGGLSRKQRHDYRAADLRHAMEALFASRKIENAPYGRKGDERKKIVLAERE